MSNDELRSQSNIPNLQVMKVLRRKGNKVFILLASCNGKELKVYNR